MINSEQIPPAAQTVEFLCRREGSFQRILFEKVFNFFMKQSNEIARAFLEVQGGITFYNSLLM